MAEIPYRVTTPLLQQTRTTRYCPVPGVINSAVLHFPPGCNSLVEIFVNLGTVQILPTPTHGGTQANIGIALDSTTQSFNINEKVKQGKPIEVVIRNHDDSNPHTNTIVILVEEKLEYTGP